MESPGCHICGRTVNPQDGSPVLWKCQSCGRIICRDHTLTIPGRVPTEYYEATLCAPDPKLQAVIDIHEEPSCWEKAGCPDE